MFRRVALVAALIGIWMTSDASAQVKLEYKFPEGSSTTQKTVLKYHQNLSVGGMDNETDLEVESNSSTAIGKRAADGTLPLTQKTNSIKVHITAGGATYDLDSADPNAKLDNPALESANSILKAVTSNEYTVVLNDKNEYKAVEGIDKILEKVKDNPMAADQIKARLSDDVLKREFDKDHGNLPKVLANKGESWEATEPDDIGSGQTLTFRRRYEYLGTKEKDGRTLDEIGIKALDVSYSVDADSPIPLKVVKSDLKIDSSTGTMLFDRERGLVVERKTKDTIKGELGLKINDMDLPAKLDLTVDQTVSTQEPKPGK